MILIADGGSTKTDWRLIDEKKQIHQYATSGFNPYFQDTEFVHAELITHLLPNLPSTIPSSKGAIYYYGAGCSNPEKNAIISDALRKCFPDFTIEVTHDLLGAARALCGRNPGIAAILGTGSNSCYYDGKEIIENVPSLGYLFGDEGSGANIGKTFIKAWLTNEVPESLSKRFYERFKLQREDILDNVYKKPLPNRFLASFSKFIYQNLKEQYVTDLVVGCFNEFFDKQISKYSTHKELAFNCVGSVGFYFSNLLRGVAEQRNIRIGKIIETPIAALTLYHYEE